MGVLARPIFVTIPTEFSIWLRDVPALGSITQEGIERLDRSLVTQADKSDLRRLAIFRSLLPIAEDPKHPILYYAAGVQDAEFMAFLLNRHGIPAAAISGKTRDTTRANVVAEFKHGRVRVLCSCQVLSTGFDAPRVTHVVMGRPTLSLVLYAQMAGRGLRDPLFGGTETCVILDCVDDYKGLRPDLGFEQYRRVWYEDAPQGESAERRKRSWSPRRDRDTRSDFLALGNP